MEGYPSMADICLMSTAPSASATSGGVSNRRVGGETKERITLLAFPRLAVRGQFQARLKRTLGSSDSSYGGRATTGGCRVPMASSRFTANHRRKAERSRARISNLAETERVECADLQAASQFCHDSSRAYRPTIDIGLRRFAFASRAARTCARLAVRAPSGAKGKCKP